MEVRKSLRIEHRKSKPLMLLKDYLLDDLSSCSSRGFMSFPRCPRHSSTAVSIRLLLDIDLRTGIPSAAKTNNKKSLNRVSSFSLFRITAVKLVNAVKSPLSNTCFLPKGGRAASKLLTSEEKDVPALGMSRFGEENRVVSEKSDAAATGPGKVGVTDSRDCIRGEATNPCSKEWRMGKEQFSPASVLNYPFEEDDDAEADPNSKSSPANLLPRRVGRRHEGLSRLAPMQLEERIASMEHEEEAARLNELISLGGEESREDAQEKGETEAVLERMLKTMKADIPSYDSKADVLILDFFREKMEEGGGNGYTDLHGWDQFEDEAVQTAEDWARGVDARETYLGWEMEGGRMAYLKDMERGKVRWNEMGNYESHEDSMRYEVCLEVEDVVWTLLVYEVFIDIFG